MIANKELWEFMYDAKSIEPSTLLGKERALSIISLYIAVDVFFVQVIFGRSLIEIILTAVLSGNW